jgi:DNA-binding XRE family transcriptional regulator
MDARSHPGATAGMTSKTLANTISQERKRQGLSQHDLATRAGLSASTVYRVESGKEVDGETELKLRTALGLPAGGQPLSALGSGALRPDGGQGTPSAMGQLVGQMMMHGGRAGADIYAALVEAATTRNDPPEVFKALAVARKEMPPTADLAWWLTRYLDAMKPRDSS